MVKVKSSTLLAELSFQHAPCMSRLCGRHVHITWLAYLAFLCSDLLHAYCNFESKKAISITLFGQCPNNQFYLA